MAAVVRRRGPFPSESPQSQTTTQVEVDPPSTPENNGPTDTLNDGTHREVYLLDRSPRMRKRRNTFIFFLGSLFGIIAAGFFAKSNDLIDFPEFSDISMDSLFDALPAGLVSDMRDMIVCMHR
jgi:phospholipid:diacylglycerol acyltransferase